MGTFLQAFAIYLFANYIVDSVAFLLATIVKPD